MSADTPAEDAGRVHTSEKNYPIKSWHVPNPKGRIGSAIGAMFFGLLAAYSWLEWPRLMTALLVAIESLALFRFYQEWVEDGRWAK